MDSYLNTSICTVLVWSSCWSWVNSWVRGRREKACHCHQYERINTWAEWSLRLKALFSWTSCGDKPSWLYLMVIFILCMFKWADTSNYSTDIHLLLFIWFQSPQKWLFVAVICCFSWPSDLSLNRPKPSLFTYSNYHCFGLVGSFSCFGWYVYCYCWSVALCLVMKH